MATALWLWVLVVVLCVSEEGHLGMATPLDDYVHRHDPVYSYRQISQHRGPDYTVYTINMTSQMWKTEATVDRPIWWHYLSITVPDVIKYKEAVLFIDSGKNTDGPPPDTDNFVALTTLLSASTGAVSANLKQVPNQPLVFKADPSQQRREEDAAVAWTWKTFIDNATDPDILLFLPMTKAAVRAMDTVTDFVKKIKGYQVHNFFVSGASKRGWTSWTTAAVDKRVVGIAPIVMDLLNMVQNLHHHYRAYGGWTFAFEDYYALNFTSKLDSPNTQLMADIIDPISYNSRLTIPKLVISTGGDEFFLPDDSHYYFRNLTPPTYLRIVPNAEHSCAGHEISLLFDLRAFFLMVTRGVLLPRVNWTRAITAFGGYIELETDQEPLTIRTYFAETLDSNRRDFRLLVANKDDPTKPFPHPVVWHTRDTIRLTKTKFRAQFDNPERGWLAFFIQMTFPGVDNGSVLEITTENQIIPNTFPFPDCHGRDCMGTLV